MTIHMAAWLISFTGGGEPKLDQDRNVFAVKEQSPTGLPQGKAEQTWPLWNSVLS